MRIIVCTRNDLKGNIALNHFLSEAVVATHQVAVILSDKMSLAEQTIPELILYEFLEHDLPMTYFKALDSATLLSPNRQTYYTFQQLAQRYRISISLHGNINTPEMLALLHEFQPDLILSCRYDYIFKPTAIQIPRLGILNIHPGVLPMYRGVLSPLQALLNNDQRLGVTVHWINAGIDTGNILNILYLDQDAKKSVFDYYIALYQLGIQYVLELLPHLKEKGNLPMGTPQGEGHYYSYPPKEEFANFAAKGISLVHLSRYLDYLSAYSPT
ncbi:methionyl-tRNA formyltransferase [Candidatus Moduliflexus flocculans]|uniref:Methionyl-tRNA formyltransferase n=1 Tax=Candidatus Moduliflexus flocculans TaxID=1499966 RepID=A0A081BTB4_9BACT|nr:methionyl-tRNA formyltransferase [Candidatus Moduliflexus flocculans]